MHKIAFIFPGQGSQYVGMGKDFFEQYQTCQEVFEKASQKSGVDVQKICFEENDQINITEYTQIAMVATEVAILRVLQAAGLRPDVTAGLSLGEYAALVAANILEEEDVFELVRKRGILMQEAVPSGGAMAAVLGLANELIEEICQQTEGMVTVANYNCPGQTVITGEDAAVKRAAEKLLEAGAKRCIFLNVSGPFHSPMLQEAGEKLGEALEKVTVNEITIPYVANCTAEYVTDRNQVKTLLKDQVSSSVKWQQSIERMLEDGVDIFIEIGPGKTLTGFMKKINKETMVMNVEKADDVQKVVDAVRAAMEKGEETRC